ncbi:lytic polysaccharide monooxygenase, partial [Aulographum hederae CBS 113979]
MRSLLLLAAALLASTATSHTIFTQFHVNGKAQGKLVGIRAPDQPSPVMDVTSDAVICGGLKDAPLTHNSTEIITVPAGADVAVEWHHGIEPQPGDKDDPMALGHSGPTIAYLAKVEDALDPNVKGLKWFKIAQDGLAPDGQYGTDRMYYAKGLVPFTIPPCIANGQYLLRAEAIALHGASSYPGAQFYMECAQIEVTGGTGTAEPELVEFPGAYSGEDPGIKINLYNPKPTSYTVPGPAVLEC